jgi:hypothetical protein
MRISEDKIDLSLLPEVARRVVFDYYQFVVQRYGRIQNKGRIIKKKLPAEFYKPIAVKEYLAVTRGEIYNDE